MVAKSTGRGAFIVFEGVDRSGKSTQAQRLVDRLQAAGVKADLWRFPDRTTQTGQKIDAYLKNTSDMDDAVIHQLFADNRWEKKEELLRNLENGVSLIVDRYAFSGAVFTAAKRVPGLTLKWCQACDRGLPAPDAVLFLDLSIEEAQKRGGFGNERYEQIELQKEVRQLYHQISQQVPNWTSIDASQSLDDISEQIFGQAIGIINDQQSNTDQPAELWK